MARLRELGLVKDPDYLDQISRDGLLEIDYLRLIGRKMGPPKGLRCNPKGEFRKGHKESAITRVRRIASLRATGDAERIRIKKGLPRKTKWRMNENKD